MVQKKGNNYLVSLEFWLVVALICALGYVFLKVFDSVIEDTETFKAEQIKNSFTGALRVLHTSWLAEGSPQLVMDFEGYGARNLNLNEHGWPVAVTGFSNSSQVTEQGCREVFYALLDDYFGGKDYGQNPEGESTSVVNPLHPLVTVLAVGTVCVYQVGNTEQINFSLLYNAESGEVKVSEHQRGG